MEVEDFNIDDFDDEVQILFAAFFLVDHNDQDSDEDGNSIHFFNVFSLCLEVSSLYC